MLLNIRKRFLPGLENKKGSVLLTTYLLITVLLLLGTAFVIISMNEGRVSESHRKIAQAFYIAEAGIERMLYDLKKDFEADENWTDGEINGWTYNSAAAVNGYFPFPNASDSDNNTYPSTVLNGGSYSVSLKNGSSTGDIWVRSTGTIGSVSQTILIYVKAVNISPWNNAIFAGAGASGRIVNGNVDIRGSVHILGDGLEDDGTAILMGGDAQFVGNNYDGLPAELESKVPVLPTTIITGESTLSETLNAELRVRNGSVSLSGSATVGEETKNNDIEDGEKENVDGCYVTDGFEGSGGAGSVYSDNSTNQAYDLGDRVVFPSLSDDSIEDPEKTVQEYFISQTNFSVDTQAGLVTELNNVTKNSSFTHYEDVNENGIFDAGDNGISMDGAGNMEIHGRVYVNGPVNIGGSDPITYAGKGTILATGDVLIATSMTTVGNNSFPSSIIGIMTPGSMTLGVSSQLNIMGLFYAEEQVTTNKQTNIVGTLVTNYFDTGGQVPAIYQVPDTAKNLPPGIISGDPAYYLKVVSWQKADNPS